jgi:hypothetical protein
MFTLRGVDARDPRRARPRDQEKRTPTHARAGWHQAACDRRTPGPRMRPPMTSRTNITRGRRHRPGPDASRLREAGPCYRCKLHRTVPRRAREEPTRCSTIANVSDAQAPRTTAANGPWGAVAELRSRKPFGVADLTASQPGAAVMCRGRVPHCKIPACFDRPA